MKNYIVLFIGFLFFSCTEYDLERVGFTQVITIGAIEVSSNSAFPIGDIENIRESSVTESGFILSSKVMDDSELNIDQAGVLLVQSPGMDTISEDRAFAARATGLNGSTEYAFRAYVKIRNEEQVAYGLVDRFITGDLSFFINSIRGSPQGCPTTVIAEIQVNGTLSAENNLIQLVYSDNIDNRLPTLENGIVISGEQVDPSGRTEIAWDVSCDQIYLVRAVFGGARASVTYSEVYAFSTHIGGTWISIEDYPVEILSGQVCPKAFATDSHGYVSGILLDGTQILWSYDPEATEWRELQNPTLNISGDIVRLNCASFIFDDPRIITGQVNFFVEYFPKTDDWARIGGDIIGHIPDLPGWSFVFGFNNLLYYGTGGGSGNSTVFRLALDTPNNREEIEIFPGDPRTRAVFFTVDNIGYVGLGEVDFNVLASDFWSFDLESESWHEIASFPEEINSRVGLSMKGKGYVLTGSDKDGNPNPGFWEYNPQLDTWNRLTDFGRGDGNADVGFVVKGVLYGGLGIDVNGIARQEFWKYVPELN